jgi:LCP family protein required for cell wall assembly
MDVVDARWGHHDPAWQGRESYAPGDPGLGAAGAVLSRPLPLSSAHAVTTDDPTQAYDPLAPDPPPSVAPDGVWDQLDQLPTIDDDPVIWDHRQGGFVPVDPSQSPKASRPEQTRARTEPPVPPPPPAAPAPVDPTTFAAPDASPVGWQRGAASAPGGSAPRPAVPGSPPGQPPPSYPSGPPGRPPSGRPPSGRSPARAPRPARWRRPRVTGRTVKRALLVVLALVMLMSGGLFAFGWVQFEKIPKVDVAKSLSPATGAGTNYLIVGTDSRAGIAADDPNAGAFLGPGDPGDSTRTDSILVMRIQGDQSSLLSIPRDLWVKNPKTGAMGRINSVYQSGPDALIKAVQNLGIPVQHYLEINFVSFAGLVDAVGGITVNFDVPTRDLHSGLKIDNPGPNHLDGVQGLAYVRSRYYEELHNGKWVADPLSDLGRVLRQRQFLSSLLHEVANSKNPFTIAKVANSLGAGLKIDNTLSYFDALGLGWKLRNFSPASNTIPVDPVTIGGAAVLKLNNDSLGVIAQYK